MATLVITNAVRSAMVDAAVAKIDAGTGAGVLRIYDGARPTGGPSEAVVAQELCVEFTLDDPSFTAATNGVATGGTIANAEAEDITTTATWARIFDSDSTPIMDVDVGLTGATINLNTVDITPLAEVSITSATLTMPSGA
jgi:hypothetical protein